MKCNLPTPPPPQTLRSPLAYTLMVNLILACYKLKMVIIFDVFSLLNLLLISTNLRCNLFIIPLLQSEPSLCAESTRSIQLTNHLMFLCICVYVTIQPPSVLAECHIVILHSLTLLWRMFNTEINYQCLMSSF